MKKIKLTKGTYTTVDNEDFDWLNQWKWYYSDNGYAMRSKHIRLGKNKYFSKKIRMHKLINKTPKGFDTDHINRNKLDNQKSNLRTLTRSQNKMNVGLTTKNKSGYKGVYWDRFTNKWRAEIKVFYKSIKLGRFLKLKNAILARKDAEIKYHAI